MGLQLEFSVEGRKEVLRDLDTRGRKAKNLQAPLKESADYMMKVIDQNFDSHGGVWGKWKRRKKAYPWRMLEKTGAMRRGFCSRIYTKQAEISNLRPYFKYHQSRQPRKYLPRRVMMAIEEQQAREITRIFQRHIM